MKRLIMMCGMIGCGKSTKARQIQAELHATSSERLVILNDDAITHMVCGGDYEYLEEFKPVYKGLVQAGIQLASAVGASVLVDRTCLDKASRDRIREVATKAGYDRHELVLFPPHRHPIHYASRRWRADSRGLPLSRWLKVAESHLSNYNDPRIAETWNRITIQEEHP